MGKPLSFSVGIPTFNQGEYLEETIVSLLDQTRPPDEIFISDHFSTDNTPEIIAKYVELGKVRAGKPPVGSNVGGQWVYTLSCLSGDWVTLFSSDDLALPKFCEVLMRGAERRDDAVLVRAAWENIDPVGKVISTEYLLRSKAVVTPPDTLLEQKNGPKASFAAFAVKRETLEESGGYPVGMESFGDWPMFMQIAPYGSIIYESEIVSRYRIHPTDKFRQRLGMWLRDEERMFYEVMPLAAQRAKMSDLAWIAEASRSNFMRYLAAASEQLTLEERIERSPLFESWAEKAGCQNELKRFAAGERIAAKGRLGAAIKRILRPYAQKLNASLHRG